MILDDPFTDGNVMVTRWDQLLRSEGVLPLTSQV